MVKLFSVYGTDSSYQRSFFQYLLLNKFMRQGWDAPGTLHHVIVRGLEKRRIVDNVKDQEAFVSRLGGIVKETKTAI